MIGAASLLCLTQAVYFEARGEPLLGQYAVAEVVMNRVNSDGFPDDVCSVTRQDLGSGVHDCQFSYECDGVPEVMHNRNARRKARSIAYVVGSGVTNITDGAEYFHGDYVSPRWASRFTLIRTIGNHLFYVP